MGQQCSSPLHVPANSGILLQCMVSLANLYGSLRMLHLAQSQAAQQAPSHHTTQGRLTTPIKLLATVQWAMPGQQASSTIESPSKHSHRLLNLRGNDNKHLLSPGYQPLFYHHEQHSGAPLNPSPPGVLQPQLSYYPCSPPPFLFNMIYSM